MSSLYSTKAWLGLRKRVLARDLWCCQFCQAMLGEGRKTQGDVLRAAVVDHIQPHRGDRGLFFDPDNLQALCKECHDSRKKIAENLGYDPHCGEDGWPVDERHPAAISRKG